MLNLSLLCEATLNANLNAPHFEALDAHPRALSAPSAAHVSLPPQQEPTGEPATGEPATGEPTTGEPTTGESTTGESTTGEPTTGEPPQLKALRWALFDERLNVRVERYPSGLSEAQLKRWCEQRSLTPHSLSALLLPAPSAQGLMTALNGLNAPFVALSFTPSVAEARASFHRGALDYLSLPELLGHGELIEQLLKIHDARGLSTLISPQSSSARASDDVLNTHTAPSPPQLNLHAPHAPLPPYAEREALMLSLIDESRPFQEALTPLEDELRRLYLSRALKREGSIASAARRAGLDRANFKRLLKRYNVE